MSLIACPAEVAKVGNEHAAGGISSANDTVRHRSSCLPLRREKPELYDSRQVHELSKFAFQRRLRRSASIFHLRLYDRELNGRGSDGFEFLLL
jgi:hypothetical protein